VGDQIAHRAGDLRIQPEMLVGELAGKVAH
jgi:hypothetical protein